jgi:hypothetical protein
MEINAKASGLANLTVWAGNSASLESNVADLSLVRRVVTQYAYKNENGRQHNL